MKTIKYILLSAVLIGFTACSEDDEGNVIVEPLPELTAGSADFSTYVSIGNSLTAGFTDNALFIAGQQNSMPNILSQRFALVGGGSFSQPLMNDNIGGMTLGGNVILAPRLFFNGSGPAPLPAMPTTEVTNINPGPYNNMGVPGAKSFHLLAPGYGNIAGLPSMANPYFVRMASSANASVLGDALTMQPTFVSLWIGNNDVLGYATSGGDGSNPITPIDGPPGVGFTQTYGTLVGALMQAGVQGVIANIPDVTSIPHFTTVPHNPVPLDAATAGLVNQGYAPYNGGLLQAESFGLISAEEREARTITFEASSSNAVVIEDESLTDLSGLGLPSYRQATADDLIVLPASSFIGTTVGGNPTLINGVSVPLGDRWVLIPSEQLEIKTATDAYNAVISASATQAGFAFVDANALLNQLANEGLASGDFIFTSDLVLGGVFSLDGVHPNSRGYALIANEFMKAIDVTYGSNFEASGNLVDVGDYPTNYPPTLQ